MPPGTEIGIDMNSWNIGDKFRGIISKYFYPKNYTLNEKILGVKMIPPGLHFVYYSSVNIKGK